MKPSSLKKIPLFALLFASVFGITSVRAANGTWTDLSGGSWATSGNWSGGTIATGSGNTADFSTLTLGSAPTVTLDGAQTIGNLRFGDAGNAYGWTLNTGSAGPLTLAGTPVIIVSNQTTTIGLVLAGTVGLGKGGPGTLVLTGANTYTGTTTITNGTVTYSGSGSYSGGSSANLNVGGVTGSGVFNMNSSGTVSFTSGTPNLGGTGGATDTGAGAFYMNSGTANFCLTGYYLTLGDEAPATQVSGMGTGAGFAYGYLNQSGGTITITASAGARVGGGGVGVWYQSGGVLTCPRYFAVGGNGTQGGNGIYTIVGGTATIGASGYYTILGGKPNAIGIMNLGTEAGGTGSFTAGNANGVMFLSDANATNGTLNLNSGTLVMNGPIQRSTANTILSHTANVNCNGGTVQAAVGLPSLFTTNSGMTIKLYKGGLTIDSQTYNVTNIAALQNAPGNGFYPSGGTLAISSGGGSGYVGAPWVNVTTSAGGQGSNTMAIATLSGGAVNSVAITCPGENYRAGDVLNFAFINGGAVTPATTYQYTIQPADLATNTGGLTKISAGSLTLSGASTYNGGTIVSAGTLYANAAGALGSGNVTVNNGATLVLTNGSGLNYINSGASLVVGSAGVVRLGYSGTDTINSLSLDGGNTFKTSGTWGAVGSSAANQSSQFTGTGILSVVPGQVATVTLNSSVNPSIYSQTVVLTTSVSGGSGTPTGTVNFMDGATTLATVTLNGAGQAAYTNTSFALGSHSLSVAYSGDHTYAPTISSTLTQTVNAGTDLWSGTVSGVWDINTTANWTVLGNPVTYQDGSNVQLDDTATGTTAITLNTTVNPLSLLATNSGLAYSITGTGGIAGAVGLNKLGTNVLTLNTANSYTGNTMITNGIVNFGPNSSSSGNGGLVVGENYSRAALNVNTTNTLSFSSDVSLGGITGDSSDTGAGAINQTSGTFNSSAAYLEIGTGGATAYGEYNLSGGVLNTLSSTGIRVGCQGIGVWLQSGGTLNCSRYFAVASQTSANNVGSPGLATFTGGSASISSSYYIIVGNKPGATGVLNLGTEAGGTAVITDLYVSGGNGGLELLSDPAAVSGFFNLNSGVLQLAGPVYRGETSGTAGMNWNGGTLQAAASMNLINPANGLSSVTVYNGGAVIDSQSYSVTNQVPLVAATGDGLYPAGGGFGVTNGGSGYVGSPLVTVSGGSGSNAMALATISNSVVNSVVITCPGQNYMAGDVLNFSFNSGGPLVPAGTFTHTLQASDLATNIGGLTKLGSGTLVLTTSNNYSGNTTVSAGTLVLAANGALGSGIVSVAPGAALVFGNGVTNDFSGNSGSLVVNSGATIDLNFTGINSISSLSVDGGNTFITQGTWGAVGSGAQNQLSVFSGTGILQVGSGALSNAVPAIVFTSPNNGANFLPGTNILFTASATEAGGTITNVTFYFNGALLGYAYTAPYAITWLQVPAGTYAMTAVASDAQGLMATSSVVNITVAWPHVPPVVSLTNPANNVVLDVSAGLTLSATASSSAGTVTNVAFYQNTFLLANVPTAPYNFNWVNPPTGIYSLMAVATDDSGASSTSSVVNVTATNSLQLATVQQIKTIFIIPLENHDLVQRNPTGSPQQLLGNPACPYFNSLITPGNSNAVQTAYATHYYSVAINGEHPSEPNYVWSEAGTDFGVRTDNDPSTGSGNQFANKQHLSAQMTAAGVPWRNYQEDVEYSSGPTHSASGSGVVVNPYNGTTEYNYGVKHNPMAFFTDTQNQNCYPMTNFWNDLTNNTIGHYNWITPDQYNEMHSGLPSGNTYHGVAYTGDQAAIAQGDNALSIIIPKIMASQAYKDHGVIIIWTDETESTDDTNTTLPYVIISPLAKGNAYASTLPYNHSSDLKTMDELFGLAYQTNAIPAANLDAQNTGYNYVSGSSAAIYDLSDFFQAPAAPTPALVVQQNGSTLTNGANAAAFGVVNVGANVSETFTVTNAGSATLALSNIVATGANAADFSVTGLALPATIAAGQSATFNAVFAPSVGGVESATLQITANDTNNNPFTLFLTGAGNAGLVITNQPANLTNYAGTTASFNVEAAAYAPLYYQWYFGTNVLAGQTNSTLNLASVGPTNVGYYQVTVSSAGVSSNSVPASLTVIYQAPNIVGGQAMLTAGGGFQLAFSGPVGQTYEVLSSDDLTVPQSQWNVVGTGTFGNTNVVFTDGGAASHPGRFYVIKSP